MRYFPEDIMPFEKQTEIDYDDLLEEEFIHLYEYGF
jgi:hypothetical protein